GPDARVADAMIAEVPTISHRATLEQAFKLLQQKSVPAVGVTDPTGKLVGLVTSETIAEMMMLREALPRGVRIGPWSRAAGAWRTRVTNRSSYLFPAVRKRVHPPQ